MVSRTIVGSLTFLSGLAALILTFLCLFSGARPSFLSDSAIITVDTLQFGRDIINTADLIPGSERITSLIDGLPSEIQDAVGDTINNVARQLGLRDFYSLHVISYCEGYYVPEPPPDAISAGDAQKNVVRCSNRSETLNFNIRTIIEQQIYDLNNQTEQELGASIPQSTLNRLLDWPDSVDRAIDLVRGIQTAIFSLYIAAIVFIALATIFTLLGLCVQSRFVPLCLSFLSIIGFVLVGVASGITTAAGVIGRNAINDNAQDLGISASISRKFFVMTWIATALMLLMTIFGCICCCVKRKDRYESVNGTPTTPYKQSRFERFKRPRV